MSWLKSVVMTSCVLVTSSMALEISSPQNALHKAFERLETSQGYNFQGIGKITKFHIAFDEQNLSSSSLFKDQQKLLKDAMTLDKVSKIMKGLAFASWGGYDPSKGRLEITYDLQYHLDNLDISLKIPLLIDYHELALYVGKTPFNTFAPIPQEHEGKLIKIALADFDKEESLKSIINERSLASLFRGLHRGMVKGVDTLPPRAVSERLVTPAELALGGVRHIDITLHDQEIYQFVMAIVDGAVEKLYEDHHLTAGHLETYQGMRSKILEGMSSQTKFPMALVMGMILDSEGKLIAYTSTSSLSDEAKQLDVEVQGSYTLNGYDHPVMNLDPDKEGSVSVLEIIKAWDEAKTSARDEMTALETKLPARPSTSHKKRPKGTKR